MNILDVVFVLILLISVIFGIYRRSLTALLGLICSVAAFLLAFAAGPRLANELIKNRTLTGLLASYTDAASLVGDYSLATTEVSTISEATLETVIKNVPLPDSISGILRQNLAGHVYAAQGGRTVNDYISATLVWVILRVGSFVLCFALLFLLMHFIVNLLDHVFQFPVLKHLDGPLAALYGLLRGMLVLYVLLLLWPVLSTIIPMERISNYLGESRLLDFFSSASFFVRVATGR